MLVHFRCFRFTIRCLGKHAIKFLSPLVNQVRFPTSLPLFISGLEPGVGFTSAASPQSNTLGRSIVLIPGFLSFPNPGWRLSNNMSSSLQALPLSLLLLLLSMCSYSCRLGLGLIADQVENSCQFMGGHALFLNKKRNIYQNAMFRAK